MNKLSYSLGLGIGQQLLQMGIDEFDVNDFAAAVKDVLEGKDPQIGHREAQTIVQTYFQQQEEKLNREKEAKGKIAKEEGEKYLAANERRCGNPRERSAVPGFERRNGQESEGHR